MASMWRRAMVYLGLVDDDDYDYDEYEPYEETSSPARRTTASVMPNPGTPAEQSDPMAPSGSTIRTLPREADGSASVQPRPAVVRPLSPVQSAKVHVIAPGLFNDAQEIGDKLKTSQPVIVNLQGVERDLARRIIDFSSGLAYGLGGQMEKVADQVFLLTPSNVEVSAEEKRRLQERGLYRS